MVCVYLNHFIWIRQKSTLRNSMTVFSTFFARNEAGKPLSETFQENKFFWHTFLQKKIVLGLQTMFHDSFNVFFSFLAETWCRTIMKWPQKANPETKTCSFEKRKHEKRTQENLKTQLIRHTKKKERKGTIQNIFRNSPK